MILIKTPLGMEEIAASRILELGLGVEVEPKPGGLPGLVLVRSSEPSLVDRLRGEIVEAERVLVVDEEVEAKLDKIVEASLRVAEAKLKGARSFAVKTVRRGTHSFTSIDVNVNVGAAIKQKLGLPVDLTCPDRVLFVEVLGGRALIGTFNGSEIHRKLGPGKHPVLPYLRRVSLVQMPYLGPAQAAREIGVRVGREAQTFEVGELVVAFIGCVDAAELKSFLDGVFEGVRSRFEVQRRVYGREVHKVPVYVQDLYQLVRERRGEPLVVFEPEGEPLPKVADKLSDLFLKRRSRVSLLIGAREGVPSGIYRFADLVVDLCPGVTIATDLAAASALIAVAIAVEERLISGAGHEPE
ncbi:MAG: SPOUT family RNA methylase [Candidatus Nezhaarchaeota archaeon]|nr:SPOUT family RNA methylase [Candidatus Nezhaarchaeota archaeon]